MDSAQTPPAIALKPGENGQPPLISTEQLFQGQNTVRIAHEGSFYLLRITRENKLILTK
jgi:hemin uptake protein HemP